MKYLTQSAIILVISSAVLLSGCTQRDPSEELRPLLEKYVGYWNTGNFQGIEEVLHPDFELRMTPEYTPEKGIGSFQESITKWRTAYPDFHIDIREWVFDSGKAAALWTITATNNGPGTHPPTGKHIKVSGMSIVHFEDGKIRDEWIASNDLLWMTQLGFKLIPPKTDSDK
ncbi:MAG: ester cyclase [Bacteroidales bacterium]|nr:ester cyclase [Bacteroidales bacterium]MCF6341803.1 ester cyclase [Bacteroidales bacterium]